MVVSVIYISRCRFTWTRLSDVLAFITVKPQNCFRHYRPCDSGVVLQRLLYDSYLQLVSPQLAALLISFAAGCSARLLRPSKTRRNKDESIRKVQGRTEGSQLVGENRLLTILAGSRALLFCACIFYSDRSEWVFARFSFFF